MLTFEEFRKANDRYSRERGPFHTEAECIKAAMDGTAKWWGLK